MVQEPAIDDTIPPGVVTPISPAVGPTAQASSVGDTHCTPQPYGRGLEFRNLLRAGRGPDWYMLASSRHVRFCRVRWLLALLLCYFLALHYLIAETMEWKLHDAVLLPFPWAALTVFIWTLSFQLGVVAKNLRAKKSELDAYRGPLRDGYLQAEADKFIHQVRDIASPALYLFVCEMIVVAVITTQFALPSSMRREELGTGNIVLLGIGELISYQYIWGSL